MKHRAQPPVTVVIAAALVLALSSCSGSGGGQGADDTLTVWMMTGGPGESPLVEDAKKAFNAQHPDITVEVEVQQWDNIVTKLTTALASDDPPDVVEMGNTQTPIQSYAGALADLTADKGSFEDSDRWLPGLAVSGERDGKLYAAPLYGGTKVVMYNKELFAKAGITAPPTTIEQLKQACDKLAAANSSTPNFSGLYMPGEYWFAGMPFVFGKAGAVATTDAEGTWSSAMSGPEAVEGLEQWRDFQNTCSTPSSVGVNTTDPEQTQIFADGQAAMLYVRAWEPADVVEKNPAMKEKLGFFIMPGYTEDTTLPVIVAGSTIGVATASSSPELAKDFVRVITGKDFQQKMAQELDLLPVATTFMPDDGATEQLRVAAEAVEESQPLPNSPGEATLETERYNEQFFSRIAGGADIAPAAAEYDEHVTETLNKLGD